jgi:RNA polymerase sigma-70 factor, ECF subfamily
MSTTKVMAEWFEQYSDDIYHFLVYRMGTTDVEDLLQEVFIRANRSLHTYKKKASPKTWLFSIARHISIDEIRNRKKLKQNLVASLNDSNNLTVQSPEMFYQETERKNELYQAILSLKPNYRDVIILRAIKELSVSETSDVLKWSAEKVRLTYHRALNKLKRKMEGE